MMSARTTFRVLAAAWLCWSATNFAGASERTQLTRTQLITPTAVERPVANHYFMPQDDAMQALHEFSAEISIPEHAMQTVPAEIRPAEILGKKTQLFPGVELRFVSHNEYLLPLDRDLIILPDSDSFWQIQVSPGRVWSEASDEGMSRASFPFLLTSIIENETYNGIATFLYDDESASQLRYQIVQQLSPFMIEARFVASTQTTFRYRPAAISSDPVKDDFEQELAARPVWREWSELENEYGEALFADFNTGIDPALVVTSGLVIDGEVFVRSMDTPYGEYPYPREMRHGVWSVAKTAAGLVTLMRMAQKYGDEILDYKIKDYLNVTAEHDGWDDVTFRHAMSMATGVGTGTHETDPNVIGSGDASNPSNNAGIDAYMAWYLAPTLQAKLDEVFRIPGYPWGPGKFARYRDRDIFTLSAALDSLYREMEGDDADIWQMMTEEVYGPIGIHHMPMSRTREATGRGIPLLAWGIYLTIDDIAKIAGLLQNGGAHDGVQLLSATGIAEALYETELRGLPTGAENKFGAKSYHLSLWHENYITAAGNLHSAPQMVGYGGNIVQLMPNGIIGFRIGNGGGRPLEQMTIIADKIRPFDEYSRRQ